MNAPMACAPRAHAPSDQEVGGQRPAKVENDDGRRGAHSQPGKQMPVSVALPAAGLTDVLLVVLRDAVMRSRYFSGFRKR